MPTSRADTRSPTLDSPRHNATSSSARAFASSRPSSWTAPEILLARSSMRTGATPLPAALPLRLSRSRGTRHELAERRRRLGCGGLLGLFEHHRSRVGSRRTTPWSSRAPPGGRSAVRLRAFFSSVDALPASQLRLALLQHRQQRRRDEDGPVLARDDPGESRKGKVLE